MKAYLDIVRDVLEKGKWKKPVRKNSDGVSQPLDNDTLALANVVFSHDMSEGFPLLTTKKMPLRIVLVELEGFIKGITDKNWYKERKCNIWNEWANPMLVEQTLAGKCTDAAGCRCEWCNAVRKEIQEQENDLGPIYGYQWRSFGEYYRSGINTVNMGVHQKFATDQLAEIVDKLHNHPYDRRMVCSAWNPNQISQMALPPCHWGWNVTVIEDTINLAWIQRSCDLMLGVPFNVASYGALLTLLAKEGGFKPGNLTGLLVDCHIYNNHIETAREQLNREPMPLPKLEIIDKPDGTFSIFNWEHTEVKLSDYQSHPKLDFGGVTI